MRPLMSLLLFHPFAKKKAKGWGTEHTVYGPDKQSMSRNQIPMELEGQTEMYKYA
jgi:hypothetical protein